MMHLHMFVLPGYLWLARASPVEHLHPRVKLFRCQNLHFLLGWFPQTIVVHPLCTESHLRFQA